MPWCPDSLTSVVRCLRRATFVALATAAVFVPAKAFAQQACGDTTCPTGFTCQTASSACPAIACQDGAPDCKPCTPSTSYFCVAAECNSDAECGAHMVCAAHETVECPTVPPTGRCAPNTNCTEPAAPAEDRATSCTTKTVSRCTPRWELPCRTASDCGEGFACKERESCTCSGGAAVGGGAGTPTTGGGSSGSSGGSGSTGATSGAAAPTATDAPARDPGTTSSDGGSTSCTCAPTGTFACEVTIKACTADADCPTDWTCRDNPQGACSSDSSGERTCTPADPAKVCMPPYFSVSRGTGGVAVGEDSTPGGAPPQGEPTTGTPAPVPGATDAKGGSGAGPGVVTAKPVTNDGCAVGTAAGGVDARAALGWSLIGLGLAVAGFTRRRRRR